MKWIFSSIINRWNLPYCQEESKRQREKDGRQNVIASRRERTIRSGTWRWRVNQRTACDGRLCAREKLYKLHTPPFPSPPVYFPLIALLLLRLPLLLHLLLLPSPTQPPLPTWGLSRFCAFKVGAHVRRSVDIRHLCIKRNPACCSALPLVHVRHQSRWSTSSSQLKSLTLEMWETSAFDDTWHRRQTKMKLKRNTLACLSLNKEKTDSIL